MKGYQLQVARMRGCNDASYKDAGLLDEGLWGVVLQDVGIWGCGMRM